MVPSNSSRSRSRFWCCDALLCGADDANVVIVVVVVVVVVPGVLLSRATTPSTMLFVGCRPRLIVMGTEGNTRPKAGTHRCDDDVNDDDMTSRRIDDDDNANVNDDGVASLAGGGVKALVRVR